MNVESSALRAAHYDAPAQELIVTFADGACYRYCGVPEHIHRLLMAAPSKGQYFNSHIRNWYPCSRLTA